MLVKAVDLTSELVHNPAKPKDSMTTNTNKIVKTAIFLLSCVTAQFASAAPIVYLNTPASTLSDLSTLTTARERLSRAGSVDQLLFKQPNPAGYPAADLFGFINNTYVGSVTYDFSVSNTPGVNGGTIAFTLSSGSATGDIQFIGSGANSTLTYTFPGISYNVLNLYGQSTTGGSSFIFSNLAFSSTGLITNGALSTTGSTSQTNGPTTYNQYVATDEETNLSLYAWALTGKATLAVGGTNPSSGEGIKWEVNTSSGHFVPVPEPRHLVLVSGLVAAAIMLFTTRRRPLWR